LHRSVALAVIGACLALGLAVIAQSLRFSISISQLRRWMRFLFWWQALFGLVPSLPYGALVLWAWYRVGTVLHYIPSILWTLSAGVPTFIAPLLYYSSHEWAFSIA
jgi:hypothetical protein